MILTQLETLIYNKIFKGCNKSWDEFQMSSKLGLLLRPAKFEPSKHLAANGFKAQYCQPELFKGHTRAYLRKYHLIIDKEPSLEIQNQLTALYFESVVDYEFDRFITGGYACTNHEKYYSSYDQFSNDDIEKLCRTCAVLEFSFEHYTHPTKLKILFKKLQPFRHLTVIPMTSLEAFRRYLDRKRKSGLPGAIIHKLVGRPSNRGKLTETMEKILIELAINGRVFKPASLVKAELDRLVELARSENSCVYSVSASRIQKFLSTPKAKNLLEYCLAEPKEFRRRVTGLMHFIRASATLVKVSVDAYVYQISYLDDETGKIDYKVGIHFHDDHSDYVFSLSLDKSENRNSLSLAFNDFLTETEGWLPRQLYMDGFTYKLLLSIPNLQSILVSKGVEITHDPNPNNRTSLERLFLTLQQKQLIKHINYIGPGIKSRKRLSHPSKTYRLIMNHKRNALKEYELDRIIKILVRECHNKSFVGNDLKTPKQRIDDTKWDGIGKIDLTLWRPLLCFNLHRVTVRGGEITVPIQDSNKKRKRDTISRNIGNDFYKNRTKEFLDSYNNCRVDAYIDKRDPRIAHIYSCGTWNKVGEMQLYNRVPNNDYDRSTEQKKFVQDFGAHTSNLIKEYQEDIKQIQGTIESETGIAIEKVTDAGNLDSLVNELSKSHAVGLDEDDDLEDKSSRKMFDHSKSRRKRRLKFDSDDEWGLELEDPV